LGAITEKLGYIKDGTDACFTTYASKIDAYCGDIKLVLDVFITGRNTKNKLCEERYRTMTRISLEPIPTGAAWAT
jgi:hypothetical protein